MHTKKPAHFLKTKNWTKQNKTKQNLLQVNDDSDNGGLKLETTLTVFTVRS